MTLRQYIPNIGTTIKMREWSDYTSRGINPWAYMKVIAITGETVSFQVLNGNQETNDYSACPLSAVQPPIGWESIYTIYVKPDKVQTVLSWFKRGIVVRANHYIGDPAGSTFQPMDNATQPHWKYPEVSDAIPADQCANVFRIVSVEEEECNETVPDDKCPRCHGLGRDTLERLAKVRNESELQTALLIANNEIRVEQFDGLSFKCMCYHNALRAMGRTKRAKAIKNMKANGWDVRYIPYAGGYWLRRRETVVHEIV